MFYLRWRDRWYLAFHTEALHRADRWSQPWEPAAPQRIEQSFQGTVNPRPFTVMGRTVFGVRACAELVLPERGPLTLVAYQMHAHEHQLQPRHGQTLAPDAHQIDGVDPITLPRGQWNFTLRWASLRVPVVWDGTIEIARAPRQRQLAEERWAWRYRFQEAWRLQVRQGRLTEHHALPIADPAPDLLPAALRREQAAHWNAMNASQNVVEDVWWRLL